MNGNSSTDNDAFVPLTKQQFPNVIILLSVTQQEFSLIDYAAVVHVAVFRLLQSN
jgi:hypothetical protein